jgi:hypothetical protein
MLIVPEANRGAASNNERSLEGLIAYTRPRRRLRMVMTDQHLAPGPDVPPANQPLAQRTPPFSGFPEHNYDEWDASIRGRVWYVALKKRF